MRQYGIKFYHPDKRWSIFCQVGLHKPVTKVAEGSVAGIFITRWTCPCQKYYWLEDRFEKTRFKECR